MKKLLVATDFSDCGLNAVNYAADMALLMNMELYLVHVYQIPIAYAETALTFQFEDLQRSAEKNLGDLVEKMNNRTGGKLNILSDVRSGTFFSELNIVCDLIKPYAVIMGNNGLTATAGMLFGSNTLYAMKHLQWPLITVPPLARFSSVKKICLACDLENISSSVPIREIKNMVTDYKAELHVLNTGKKDEYNTEIVFSSSLLQSQLAPIIPHYHFISSDKFDEAVIDFIEKSEIDLLIILPKRHSLLDKLIHTSHTKQVILHSHIPVMSMHMH